MRLEKKTALVTGGGSGIGRAIALKLAREGARVCISGRTREKLEQTRQAAESHGIEIETVVGDVTQHRDVRRMVEKTIENTQRMDILVNNAGMLSKPVSIEEIEEKDWDAVMAVNLKGPFLCCREVAPLMRAQKSGKIVNVGSIGAIFSFRPVLPYSASKAGLSGLTRLLAVDLAPDHVCVNAVLPGPTATGLWEQITPEEQKAFFRNRIPMGRVGSADEVADVVCFLASDEANYLTGESIVLAGGLPAQPFAR